MWKNLFCYNYRDILLQLLKKKILKWRVKEGFLNRNPPWAFYLGWKCCCRGSCSLHWVWRTGWRTPASVSPSLLFILLSHSSVHFSPPALCPLTRWITIRFYWPSKMCKGVSVVINCKVEKDSFFLLGFMCVFFHLLLISWQKVLSYTALLSVLHNHFLTTRNQWPMRNY